MNFYKESMKKMKKAVKGFANIQSNVISNSFGGSITQINSSSGSSTTINGKTYKGNNIQINGNKVIIDGVVQKGEDGQDDKLTGNISIVVNGNCDSVESDMGDITINGETKMVTTSNGDVTIGKDVKGNVSTSNGDVDVKGSIAGNVSTSNGDITSRK